MPINNQNKQESVDATIWAQEELSKTTFGQLLRSLRESDSINQIQLAKRIGVSKQFLSDIELDRRIASISFVKKISQTMGYAIEPLIEIVIRDDLKKNNLNYDVHLKIKNKAA